MQGKNHLMIVVVPENLVAVKEVFYKKYFSKVQMISTENSRFSELSTGDIVKAIRNSRKSVLLLCEEKSAADCLESLLQYPKLSKKVKNFISINGKIKGAENAEKAKGPLEMAGVQQATKVPLVSAFRFLVDSFVHFFSGYDPVLYSFSPKVRTRYLRMNLHKIQELSKETALISVDSSDKNYGIIPYSTPLF